jgi:hypothetical protein
MGDRADTADREVRAIAEEHAMTPNRLESTDRVPRHHRLANLRRATLVAGAVTTLTLGALVATAGVAAAEDVPAPQIGTALMISRADVTPATPSKPADGTAIVRAIQIARPAASAPAAASHADMRARTAPSSNPLAGGTLPETGSPTLWLMSLATLLLGAGGLATLVARKNGRPAVDPA